jgi:hypothetical protein
MRSIPLHPTFSATIIFISAPPCTARLLRAAIATQRYHFNPLEIQTSQSGELYTHKMAKPFEDKVVLVTGGASGIGYLFPNLKHSLYRP